MLVVKLWLMDYFDSFLTGIGHVANLPENTVTKNEPMLSQTAFEDALFEYENDEETEEDGEELD